MKGKRESTSTGRHISKEECEKRILERFPSLIDDKLFHNYFCSYDFHYHENDMLEFWRDVLMFLYESVYETFAININEILEKTKLRNRRPLGLINIITELIKRGEYVLASSLKNEEYFKKNYSSLYKKEGWGSWVKKGLVTTVKIPFKMFGIGGSGPDSNNPGSHFKPDDLLIQKRLFHKHLESIINLLSRILIEEDIEVFTKFGLVDILINSNLHFKDSYLDLCLDYLNKIKKIAVFKVRVENVDIECVKLLRDENSTVTEKDKAIINILEQLKNFDKKMEDTMNVVQDCLMRAKVFLKNKNKDAAMNCLKKKNLYLKAYNHYSNLKMTLEQNLIDIKSMQSNQNVKNILESVVKTSENLKMNVEEFNEVSEKLRVHKENMNEAKDILNEYNDEHVNVSLYLLNL